MKLLPPALLIAALSSGATQAAETELWRLDCGTIALKDMNAFSDNFAYSPAPKSLTNSCYLIRHDGDYLLWDTGLPLALLNAPTDAAAHPGSSASISPSLSPLPRMSSRKQT